MNIIKDLPFGQILKLELIKMIGNSIIKLNNVDIFQQKHLVLSNVNLHVDKGDFVWLIGQTGSGKSSLLKVIYGDLDLVIRRRPCLRV